MPKSIDPHNEKVLMVGAALLDGEGKNQDQIAKRLSVSQPKVSRLLASAAEKNLTKTIINAEVVGPEIEAEVIERFFKYAELETLAQKLFPYSNASVKVVTGAPLESHRLSALCMADFIRRSKKIGVAWGGTLQAMIEQIGTYSDHSTSSGRTVVPVCPEPIFLNDKEQNPKFSSSQLAMSIRAKFAPPSGARSPDLRGVPSYIPIKFKGPELEAIHRFIQSMPGYQSILAGEKATVKSLDTVLTGVGMATPRVEPFGVFLNERIEQEKKLKVWDISELVYGDIAGVLIPRSDLAGRKAKFVQQMNENWLGISYKQLQACARNAYKKHKPGVCIFATNVDKAEIVRACIERGLCNTLVASQELVSALVKS